MIIVTGGAGFIGSQIIQSLNTLGYEDILVVDNLKNGYKFRNLVNLKIRDYQSKEDFITDVMAGSDFGDVEAVFHQGACSSTTEWDGQYMMENNYEYSKVLLHYCLEREIPFIYASSAATYGNTTTFVESSEHEGALNVYGYSKQLFDNYVRALWRDAKEDQESLSPVIGLRYFNVYGPGEAHKGSMSSVAYHLHQQMLKGENPKLFAGSEQFLRDFIYVEDVAKVNLWAMKSGVSGIFNCGSGRAEPFSAVANAVIAHHGRGTVEYIPFPEHLKGSYQAYTCADLTALRKAGCSIDFKTVAEGVSAYLKQLSLQ